MKFFRANFLYLSYLFRHKYYVFVAGVKVGAPIFRLVIHDWHKFLPSEYFAYLSYFYYGNKDIPLNKDSWKRNSSEEVKKAFDLAWNFHQKRAKHHYQYWVLIKDDGTIKPLEMPST